MAQLIETPARSDGTPPASRPVPAPRLAGEDAVPRGLAITAAVFVRLVIVAGGLYLAGLVALQMLIVVIPVVIALLLTTLFAPLATWLEHHGWRRGLAAAVTVGGGVAVVIGVFSLIIPAFIAEIGNLGKTIEQGVRSVGQSLSNGPLGISQEQIDSTINRAASSFAGDSATQGVVSGAILATQWVTSLLLAIILTFFFVKDGATVWRWITSLFAPHRRPVVHEVGLRAWDALTGYFRGVALVATVDATLIGIVLFVLGVPLAMPLIVLTFLAAFFPVIGAIAAGFAAVLVALATKGVFAAAVIAGAILVIQQLEGNVFYPVVVGRKLHLHPVAMLLALAIGGVVGGIAGAFLAVPVAAVIGTILNYMRSADFLGRTTSAGGVELAHPGSERS